MRYRPWPLLAVCIVAASFIFAGCGGGGSSPSPSAASTSATPAGSAGATAQPSSPEASATAVDLASTSPMSVIYAVSEGDLRSDQPGLAAGDINGDHIGDVIVGGRFADGPNGRTDSGEAYIIFGAKSPPASVDLAQAQQDVTIAGANPGDSLGYAVAAGDVNGDGVGDLILGAPFAPPPDQNTRPLSVVGGSAYIFFGRSVFPAAIDLAATPADVTISGDGAGAFFGDSLATGDINHDGVPDLIIGAPFDSTPATFARGGATYVYFGSRQWPATLSAADADVSLYAADDGDELGDFVTSGDVNGDGIADVIATAEAADGPDNSRITAAEVHVLYGHPDLHGSFQIGRNEDDVAIYGAVANDTLGFSLAAGDVDGDGIDDIVMGARFAAGAGAAVTRAGKVYVLYGRTDLPRAVDLATPPDYVATLYGPVTSALLGICELVADVDGDGHNDLVMGTGNVGEMSRSNAGAVYISSPPAGGSLNAVNGGTLRTIIEGAETDAYLGSNLAATDFNGDGRLDLVTVAQGASGPDGPGGSRAGAGRVYVLSLGP
ncbi:MAG: FG-GAP-like repeat-containing protein [Dehalococcoidia bacterium]|nr:FG-GAP-like repeat-containing protein [Dehalococcoidia bacterium]